MFEDNFIEMKFVQNVELSYLLIKTYPISQIGVTVSFRKNEITCTLKISPTDFHFQASYTIFVLQFMLHFLYWKFCEKDFRLITVDSYKVKKLIKKLAAVYLENS